MLLLIYVHFSTELATRTCRDLPDHKHNSQSGKILIKFDKHMNDHLEGLRTMFVLYLHDHFHCSLFVFDTIKHVSTRLLYFIVLNIQ